MLSVFILFEWVFVYISRENTKKNFFSLFQAIWVGLVNGWKMHLLPLTLLKGDSKENKDLKISGANDSVAQILPNTVGK